MTACRPLVHRPVAQDARPLVLHIVHRFDVGGLENGVVNLVDGMPVEAYRHAVLALTEATDFRHRIRRDDVGTLSLHKPPGHGWKAYPAIVRLLRELKPAVVHTRNLGPLEMQAPAAWAGVRARVHGEHGRELSDLDGTNRAQQWVRRVYAPFVHRYVALSCDLRDYLVRRVGVAAGRVAQIYNGVDTERFSPAVSHQPGPVGGCPFVPPHDWLVGTVGRLQGVKRQTDLVRAFVRALQLAPAMRADARLVIVGEGPLRAQCAEILAAAGCADLAWIAGERADVADVMRGLSCFVLPSLAEGISNTILEAMATGLPVIATCVGGNPELVLEGETGCLVPAADVEAMAQCIARLHADRASAWRLGDGGRRRVLTQFSLAAMVAAYRRVYDEALGRAPTRAGQGCPSGATEV